MNAVTCNFGVFAKKAKNAWMPEFSWRDSGMQECCNKIIANNLTHVLFVQKGHKVYLLLWCAYRMVGGETVQNNIACKPWELEVEGWDCSGGFGTTADGPGEITCLAIFCLFLRCLSLAKWCLAVVLCLKSTTAWQAIHHMSEPCWINSPGNCSILFAQVILHPLRTSTRGCLPFFLFFCFGSAGLSAVSSLAGSSFMSDSPSTIVWWSSSLEEREDITKENVMQFYGMPHACTWMSAFPLTKKIHPRLSFHIPIGDPSTPGSAPFAVRRSPFAVRPRSPPFAILGNVQIRPRSPPFAVQTGGTP